MRRVFFSYASEDKAKVRSLAFEFQKHKIEVLIDYDVIEPGQSIPAKINEMIRESDGAVVCYSAAYSRKPWTGEEQAALQFRLVERPGWQLVVVKLDDAELPPLLAHRLWTSPAGMDALAATFAGDVRKTLGRTTQSAELREWLYVFSDDDLERMATVIQAELRKSPTAGWVEFTSRQTGAVVIHLALPVVERLADTLAFLLRVLERVNFIRSRLREQIASAGLGIFEGSFVLAERERMQQVESFRQELRSTLDALVERVVLR